MFWFYHRNQLKLTYVGSKTFIASDLLLTPLNHNTNSILQKLDLLRTQIIRLMMEIPDATNDELLENLIKQYLSLFSGLVFLPNEQDFDEQSNKFSCRSPLRKKFRFQWHDSVIDFEVSINDTLFELISLLTNYGIWLMHYLQEISLILPMNYLPQHITAMQKILGRAAGLFQFVNQKFIPLYSKKFRMFFDNDPNVLQTYYFQCLAEAWELPFIKVLQDIVVDGDTWQLNPYGGPFNPRSIAQLSLIIYNNFYLALERIKDTITTNTINNQINNDGYDQWSLYLEIKATFYKSWNIIANAYDQYLSTSNSHKTLSIILQDLLKSNQLRKKCKNLCKEYNSKTKQPEQKINRISFFEELRLYILMLKHFIKDNYKPTKDFIKTTFPSLDPSDIEPIPFKFPSMDAIWNLELYNEFGVKLFQEDITLLKDMKSQQRKKSIKQSKTRQDSSEICGRFFQPSTWTRWLKRSPKRTSNTTSSKVLQRSRSEIMSKQVEFKTKSIISNKKCKSKQNHLQIHQPDVFKVSSSLSKELKPPPSLLQNKEHPGKSKELPSSNINLKSKR